jgi:hypothetical protein
MKAEGAVAEKPGIALILGGAAVHQRDSGFWVAQRFTAAIIGLFPSTALAAEVTPSAPERLFPQPAKERLRAFEIRHQVPHA